MKKIWSTSPCWFTPQVTTTAEAWAGQGQALRAHPCAPTQVEGSQLRAFACCLPRVGFTECAVAPVQCSDMRWGRPQFCLNCCTKCLSLY